MRAATQADFRMQQQPTVPRQGRRQDTIDANRIGNILQTAFADVLERNFDDLANLIVDGLRDANSSRLGQLFQPSSNIYASPITIVIFRDYIAQIDTDAELHPFSLGYGCVAHPDLVLDLGGAANGLDDTGELGNDAVPRTGEDVTLMRCNRLLHHRTIDTQFGG